MKNLEALFNISYGLYIISSKNKEGKFNGFVGNAVTQVNSEPPTFAIVINKNNLTHQYIKESGLLSISILSINTPLSFIGQFGFKSGREIDKFQNVNYKISECGVPIVTDYAISYIVCKVFSEIDRGSHTIFLADLLECEILKEEEPMTYLYYRKIKRGTTSKNAPTYVNKSTNLQEEKKMQKYICKICNYIYDPALGDPDSGISPGTPFENLPDSWVCPVCGASKEDFEKYDG